MKEFAAVITIDIPVLLTAENKNDAECKAVKNNPFVLKNKKVFGRKKLLLACSSHTEVSEMTLNEIITYAKDHEIDFDKPVVGHVILNCAVPFTIFKCNKSFKKKLLMFQDKPCFIISILSQNTKVRRKKNDRK